MEIVKEIYNIKGMSGFYVGSQPNLARCLVRNCYKYPLLVGLPKFYEDKLSISGSPLKLLTGFSLAFGESIISCPLERAKVYFMTSKEITSYSQFFDMVKGNRRKELFRGFTPLLAK